MMLLREIAGTWLHGMGVMALVVSLLAGVL
jgi:hypothetical protein